MTDVKLVDIKFSIHGRVLLDMDRAMEDPWWEQYTKGYNLNDPAEFKQAVIEYVKVYLSQEDLLSENAPWTCGPADLYGVEIVLTNQLEVKSGGEAGNSGTEV